MTFRGTVRHAEPSTSNAKAERSVIDLAASTDSDERAGFFEHGTGCCELGIAFGTDRAEMRIAENAWRRFATAAKRDGL